MFSAILRRRFFRGQPDCKSIAVVLTVLALLPALCGPAAVAAGDQDARPAALESADFSAALGSAFLESGADWDPHSVDKIVQGVTKMLERRGITPTREQIGEVYGAARTGFFNSLAVFPYHHPINRRLLVLEVVRKIERYFVLGPPDPEKRKAATGQAEALMAEWQADLLRLFPDRREIIEEVTADLFGVWTVSMRRPLSNYFVRPAGGLDVVQIRLQWARELTRLRIVPESGSEYVRKALRSALRQGFFCLQHATAGPRLPESAEMAEAARQREQITSDIHDYEAYARLAFLQEQREKWRAEQEAAIEAALAAGVVPVGDGQVGQPAPDLVPATAVADFVSPQEVRRIEPRRKPLEAALIEGDFDAVLAATEGALEKGADADFELLRLRARAAAESYWRFFLDADVSGRQPTVEEADALYRLSEQCTEAFEAAFLAAESTYQRACLTAAWWPVRLNPRFEAESMLMRSGTPNALREAGLADGERAARQANVLADVCRGVLDLTPRAADLSAAEKEAVVRVLREQYEDLGAIGVPDEVFSGLLEDLPAFVGFWCPLGIADRPGREDDVRWYLWVAMTQSQPGPAERAAIDKQAEEFGAELASVFDSLFAREEFERTGQAHADLFMQSYQRLCDNRFAPYFKKVRFAHEARKCRESLASTVDAHRSSLKWAIESAVERAATAEDRRHRLRRAQELRSPGLLHFAFYSFVRYSDPARRLPLAERLVRSSGANLNDHGVLVFTVGQTEPFPPPAGTLVP